MQANSLLRTPRAAGVAGVLFALLLAMTLVLLRLTAPARVEDARVLLTDPRVRLALGLVPFAGIAFLWLIGVVRDRIGAREDRFLATVSLGSGLLFIAMLFVASAVGAGTLATASSADTRAANDAWVLGRSVAAAVLHTYAMRMAAVFMFSTSTIALRTGFIPHWIAFSGYAVALVLLVGINLTLWVELLFPVWILLLSFSILAQTFRERPDLAHVDAPGDTHDPDVVRRSA
jgi:hypothetical protein